jgi:hypothetical protein
VSGQRRERMWRSIAHHVVTNDQQGWARAVCAVCVAAVAAVEAAALTLYSRSQAQEMLAATDEWSAGLEETQYTLGEGPGVQAFVDGSPILIDDLTLEQKRWPVFAEAALRFDAIAMFSFPLQVGAIRIGTLNMYRYRPGRLSAEDVANAALLADLATIAMLNRDHAALDWARPIGSYQDVNIATGMICARLGISLDDALVRLRGYAFAENRSIFKIARDIMERRISLDHFPEY